MKSPVLILTIVCTLLYQITASDGDADDHPCSDALSAYPRNETDPDGNVYLMQITSASCTCTTDDTSVLCEYSIEGTSDKGSTKYDSVSCDAAVCDEEVTAEGGFTKVCNEPEDWKDNSEFDVTLFDQAVFEPWCVDPSTLENNGSVHFEGFVYMAMISAGLVAVIM